MSNTENFTNIISTFTAESEKFWGGNNAAGTRARKALQEVIKYSRDERKSIQAEKNKRKGK